MLLLRPLYFALAATMTSTGALDQALALVLVLTPTPKPNRNPSP